MPRGAGAKMSSAGDRKREISAGFGQAEKTHLWWGAGPEICHKTGAKWGAGPILPPFRWSKWGAGPTFWVQSQDAYIPTVNLTEKPVALPEGTHCIVSSAMCFVRG